MQVRRSQILPISLLMLGILTLPFPTLLQTSMMGTVTTGPRAGNSADVEFPLLPFQYVEVEVKYIVGEGVGRTTVYGFASYAFPTKMVRGSHSTWRFWNETHVAFRMGWEHINALEGPLGLIFFRGLGVRVFYEGETPVNIFYTIRHYTYANYYISTVLFGCVLGLAVWERKKIHGLKKVCFWQTSHSLNIFPTFSSALLL